MRIGILTGGGDCPGLNAGIRAVSLQAISKLDAGIIGIENGIYGLIHHQGHTLTREMVEDILPLGGTMLGSVRVPFKSIRSVEQDGVNKVQAMKKSYVDWGLDALVILGGNGSHKTANLLSQEGLNIIALPKTIDNDIYGTDMSFGFHSAIEEATEAITRCRTTANSHMRAMLVEIMGNKTGWLTLYAGVAGGADIVLLPEMPFDPKRVAQCIDRVRKSKRSVILAVAEGAMTHEEAAMKKSERNEKFAKMGMNAAHRIANQLQSLTDMEMRVVVPGYMQRGEAPCAFDRALATRFGSYAVELIRAKTFGVAVGIAGDTVIHTPLHEVAGVTRPVPPDHQMVRTAKGMGIEFGN